MAAIGVACVVRARRARDLPLAALPLLLGAHQIIESAVWRADGGSGPATLAWAVIALPLLPLWVPLGVLCAAPAHARRRLSVPLAAGAVTGGVLAYSLATRPVTAHVRGHTLGYAVDLPYPLLLVAGYLVAAIGSLLLSGDRRIGGARGARRGRGGGLRRAVAVRVHLHVVRVRRRLLGGPARLDR